MQSGTVRYFTGAIAMMIAGAHASAPLAADRPGLDLRGAPLSAAEPAPLARLEVHASAACATREQLMARISARSPRIRFTEAGDAAFALRATIVPGPTSTVSGELVVAPAGGDRSTRRLAARSCVEAVDALALVAVMALDPAYLGASAQTSDRRSEPAPVPAAPQPSVPERTAEPARERSNDRLPSPAGPSAPSPSPAVAPSPALPPSPAATGVTPSAEPAAWAGGHTIGVMAGGVLGPAPRPLAALGLDVGWAISHDPVWSLGLVLAARHALARDIAEHDGNATFTLDTLSLDVCPLRLRVSILEARPCAAATGGWLTASGSATYSPESHLRPFAALGGSARLSANLGRSFAVSGRMGAGASLIRDAFEFTPTVFHRVASVTLELTLGLAMRFP